MATNDTVLGSLTTTVQCFTPMQISSVLQFELTGILDWASLVYMPLIVMPALVFSWVCGGNQSHLTMPLFLTMGWTALAYLNFTNFFQKRLDIAQVAAWTELASAFLFLLESIYLNRQALLRLRAAFAFSADDPISANRLKGYHVFAQQLFVFISAVACFAIVGTVISIAGQSTKLGFEFPAYALNIFPFLLNILSLIVFYTVERLRPFTSTFAGQFPPRSASVSKRLADFLTLSSTSSTSTLQGRSLPSSRDHGPVYIYSLLDFLPDMWRIAIFVVLISWTVYLLLQVILSDVIPLLATNIFTTVRLVLLLCIAILLIAFARNPNRIQYVYPPDESSRSSSPQDTRDMKPGDPFMRQTTEGDTSSIHSIQVTEETTRVEMELPPSPRSRARKVASGSLEDAVAAPPATHPTSNTASRTISASAHSSYTADSSTDSSISSIWTNIEAEHAIKQSSIVHNVTEVDDKASVRSSVSIGISERRIMGLSGTSGLNLPLDPSQHPEKSLLTVDRVGYPRLSHWTDESLGGSRPLTPSGCSIATMSSSAFDPDEIFQRLPPKKRHVPLPPIRIPRSDGLYV